ncbi:uncharacterized protein Z519_04497 [Cladophialophora bantiana CBS 173.52]|uniref:DUF6314 domain-containing protein n=1 Tax=Cladophialophora bantiana (strain ATCC 10958 / CBS 173.52 / CDC B-1940 / NIH 8579) TaxID=1442370 RepID=A0A0D2EXA8_CLAB1|nr:uncharacterized protein Z519_04497 [Cladophialophora bantiana CBS 173.52]KIW94521.1 hypothetical protein Z519_04497 [Cladophialophora bantiana CBS 173.52]
MSQSIPSHSALLINLFQDLSGSWLLNRKLQSADSSAPSGRCSGTATFTTRAPSPVLDADGNLHIAHAELLYHEQGEFEMMKAVGNNLASVPTFTFARKYIWRLQRTENAVTISIWFTKPGTETIDYLFHKIDLPFDNDSDSQSDQRLVLHGTGGHLCVEDFYNSSYSFTMSRSDPSLPLTLSSWTTVHEVLGPKKDQYIETTFARP